MSKHRPWLTALLMRRPTKVAAIAFADRIVRMAWAMMAKGEPAMRVERLAAHAQPAQPVLGIGGNRTIGCRRHISRQKCCTTIKLLPNEAPSTALIGIFPGDVSRPSVTGAIPA
jgi:hypothetical protein